MLVRQIIELRQKRFQLPGTGNQSQQALLLSHHLSLIQTTLSQGLNQAWEGVTFCSSTSTTARRSRQLHHLRRDHCRRQSLPTPDQPGSAPQRPPVQVSAMPRWDDYFRTGSWSLHQSLLHQDIHATCHSFGAETRKEGTHGQSCIIREACTQAELKRRFFGFSGHIRIQQFHQLGCKKSRGRQPQQQCIHQPQTVGLLCDH